MATYGRLGNTKTSVRRPSILVISIVDVAVRSYYCGSEEGTAELAAGC